MGSKKERAVSSKLKKKKSLNDKQKKGIWTLFTLLFPSLLLAIIVSFTRTVELSIIGVLLFFYQAILLKNFIERHYDVLL